MTIRMGNKVVDRSTRFTGHIEGIKRHPNTRRGHELYMSEKEMSETREFPTAVIASISTGVLLCEFSKLHEAAEFLMGHPIWTHHFASKQLTEDMKRAIAEQCPGMPTEIEGINHDNYLTKVAEIEAEIGKTVRIRRGSGVTAMHPLDGIPDGKPVIVVKP